MKSGSRASDLMREREILQMRCDAQRSELAETIDQLEGPLKVADRALAGVDYLRSHPLVFGAALTALVVIGRRGWWGWLRRGFFVWRAYRAFRGSIAA